MKKLVWLLVAAVWFLGGQAAVADEFSKVKCWVDIPKALINQRSSNERVVITEAKWPALNLKYLGAAKVSNQLATINWYICGAEYVLLVDRKGFIRDAIRFPPHTEMSPAFFGRCKQGDAETDMLVGIANATVLEDQLPVLAAWKIDLKEAKFVKQEPVDGLRCPRRASYRVDAGS